MRLRDLLQAANAGSAPPSSVGSSSGSGGLNDDQVIIIISVVVGTLLLVVVGLGVWYLWWEYRTSTWEEHELAAQAMASAVTTPSTAVMGSPHRSPGGDTCKTLVYTPGTVAASPSMQGSPSANPSASNRAGSDADKLPQPQFWEAEAAARNGLPVNPDSFRLEHTNSSALAQSSSLYGHKLPEEDEDKEEGSSGSDAQPRHTEPSQAAAQQAAAGSKPNSKPGSPRFVLTGLTAAGVRHVKVNKAVKEDEEIEMSLAPSPATNSTPTCIDTAADSTTSQQTTGTQSTPAASAGATAAAGAVAAAAVVAGSGVMAKTLVIPSRSFRVPPGRSSSNISTGTNTHISLVSRPSGTPSAAAYDRTSDAGSVSTITVASHVVGMFPPVSTSLGGLGSSTAGSVRSDGTASTAVDAGTQTDGTIAMVLLTSANGAAGTAGALAQPATAAIPPGHITTLASTPIPLSPSPSKPVREVRQVPSFAGRWSPVGSTSQQQLKLTHAGASSPMLEELAKDGSVGGRREFRHSASTGNVSAASSPNTKVMKLVQQLETCPDPHLDTPGREGSISPSDSAFHTAHATPYSTPYTTPPGSRSSETSATVSSSANAVSAANMAIASARLYNNALSMSMQRNVPALPPRSFVPGPNSRSLGRTASDASTASEHLRMQGSSLVPGTADKDMVADLEGSNTGTPRMASPGNGGHQGSPRDDTLDHGTLGRRVPQRSSMFGHTASSASLGAVPASNQAYAAFGEIEPASDDDGMVMLPMPPAQAPGTPAR